MWQAARGWSRDDVPRLGASIAYYTLFSLAPILIIAIAIAGFFFGREAVQGQIVGQLTGLIGADGAHTVQGLLKGAAGRHGGVIATIIGTITFLAGSTGAFLELQHALNTIFQVKTDSGPWLKELISSRLRSFGLVLSIGFLLLVSLAVSAALAAASSWGQARIVGWPVAWQIVNWAVSLAVTTTLFALIYRFLPDVRLEWRNIWIGAFVTALLFGAGKQLIGLYLGQSSVRSTYGAAGSVIVLLLWVYYSAQLILFGAELTRVYSEHREGARPSPTHLATRDDSLRPSAPKVAPNPHA